MAHFLDCPQNKYLWDFDPSNERRVQYIYYAKIVLLRDSTPGFRIGQSRMGSLRSVTDLAIANMIRYGFGHSLYDPIRIWP